MNLQEFVGSALVQIVRGVMHAQEQLRDTGALVNPGSDSAAPGTMVVTHESGLLSHVKNVSFDVAVTIGDEQSAAAGAGIKVWGARLGADGKVTYENSTVSRVQFIVPIALPLTPSAGELKRQSDFHRPLPYR